MSYFIAPDAAGDLTIWRQTEDDALAYPVLARYQVDDAEAWDRIVGALAGEA